MKQSIRAAHSASAPPPRRSGQGRRLVALLGAATLGIGLLSGTAIPAHAAVPYFCADDTQPYAPVADVEAFAAGEPVTGLSVTHGTDPDAFTGTYVGYIASGIGTGKDMLLFKLSSPVIDGTAGLKAAGIWAGMSGSPVYDKDHRLIGAVAYSLNSDNLPIAGVTPAEYMKAIGSTVVGTAAKVRVTSSNLRVSATGTKVSASSLVGGTFTQARTVNVATGAGARANAFANRTLARTPRSVKAAAFLRSNSFVSAAAQASSTLAPLAAGGTVAALYSSGDVLIGGIGTVTAICGNTVWAFGHPLGFEGTTKVLMANASTALIVPDATGIAGSFKQFSRIGAPLGMITQDRLVGIRGTVGATDALAIDVNVQNAVGTQVATYHADVSDPELSPTVVAYLTGEAAYEQLDQYGAGTGEVAWSIDYTREDDSTGTVANSQVAADQYYFPDTIGTPPAEALYSITGNEFEDVAVTSVSVTLKLISADAVTYKASDAQVFFKGAWSSLTGKRLKAGTTYSIKPQYKVVRNGRSKGTVEGQPVTVKLSSSARKRGTFEFSPANQAFEDCETDSSGNTICFEFSSDDSDEYTSFDDVVDTLNSALPDSAVTAEFHYRLKKGSRTVPFDWTGPGVVTGDAIAPFTIKS